MADNRDENVEDENAPLIRNSSAPPLNVDYSTMSIGENSVGDTSHRSEVHTFDHEDAVEHISYYQSPQADSSTTDAQINNDAEFAMLRGVGPTVTCRICEVDIQLEGRTTHVVRCHNCNEVTPIRAAPPGKKYVRCPCNCLLICKASSNRIACPRPNCRRVITLVATAPVGTAVRAPAGTCRVQCCHCEEMFMFNTLVNTVASCPHCKKSSSVGANYARSRALIYVVSFFISFLILLGVVLGTFHSDTRLVYLFWVLLAAIVVYCICRFVYFARLKVSQVLGPI